MKQDKKTEEKVEVDISFLMKMAEQIDILTAKIKEFETPKTELKQNETQIPINTQGVPQMNYKLVMTGLEVNNVNYQKEFLAKFLELIKSYNVVEFKAEYRK